MRKFSLFQYVSKKMQGYTVYLYLETALRVSGGRYLHPSLGAHTTVPTASGIYHTVTTTCSYRGCIVVPTHPR
jgi:hypothetical protein